MTRRPQFSGLQQTRRATGSLQGWQHIWRLVCGILLAFAAALPTSGGPAQTARGEVIVLTLEEAIGPASASYIVDGLDEAEHSGADLVVIAMDTPGGLDTSMREIIRAILASDVPVAAYVHPSGGRAASAGTFILYASHFAAMTPGTNLGAATPVQIGAPSPMDGGDPQGEDDQPDPANALDRKAVNDAAAYIRSLAELRGRNAEWAEEAVRGAASLSADAALERGVIELVAPDIRSLLEQLDGRSVTIGGRTWELTTSDLQIREIEPDWITRALATITNPNVALILIMIGVYGLFFEFLNPGALVPGTVGAICLLIGMYALAVLPVDYVGVALIVLGIGLMVAEAFAPSFGALGTGGIVSFIFGAAMLFDTDVPAFRVSWSVIAAIGVFSAGFLILVARAGLASFRHRVVSGAEELIGAVATVIDWDDGEGHVFVHSERWNARGPSGLGAGDTVIVEELSGLDLAVTPARDSRAHPDRRT